MAMKQFLPCLNLVFDFAMILQPYNMSFSLVLYGLLVSFGLVHAERGTAALRGAGRRTEEEVIPVETFFTHSTYGAADFSSSISAEPGAQEPFPRLKQWGYWEWWNSPGSVTWDDVDFGPSGTATHIKVTYNRDSDDSQGVMQLLVDGEPITEDWIPEGTGCWTPNCDQEVFLPIKALEGTHDLTFKAISGYHLLNLKEFSLVGPTEIYTYSTWGSVDVSSSISAEPGAQEPFPRLKESGYWEWWNSPGSVTWDDVDFGPSGATTHIMVTYNRNSDATQGVMQFFVDGEPITRYWIPMRTGCWTSDCDGVALLPIEALAGTHDLTMKAVSGYHLLNLKGVSLAGPKEGFFLDAPKKTCIATSWGDPHLVTFDGLKYDVHALGEVILLKSLDSEFEIQGRMEEAGHFGGLKPAVTTGVAVRESQEKGLPEVQVSMANDPSAPDTVGSCPVELYVDGEKLDLQLGFEWDDVKFSLYGQKITLEYPTVRLELEVSFYGRCFFSVNYILLDDCRPDERLVGLLGTPNGNLSDDWMTRDGTTIPLPEGVGGFFFGPAYEYSTTNWCIADPEESFFTYEPSKDFYDYAHCGNAYNPDLEDQVNDADPDLQDLCDGDLGCVLDGIVLGEDAAEEELENPANDRIEPVEFCDDYREIDFSTDDEGFPTGSTYVFPTSYTGYGLQITAQKEEDENPVVACYSESEIEDIGKTVIVPVDHTQPGSDPPCGGMNPMGGDILINIDQTQGEGMKIDLFDIELGATIFLLDSDFNDVCEPIIVEAKNGLQTVRVGIEGVAQIRVSLQGIGAVAKLYVCHDPYQTPAPFGVGYSPPTPSESPVAVIPIVPDNGGGGYGDPHLKTWRGRVYDFHGECDLLLTKSLAFREGLGFEAQIRTTIRDDWSFISSIAVKIGQDVFEVQSGGIHLLNGVENVNLKATTLGGYQVNKHGGKKDNGAVKARYQINMEEQGMLEVKVYNEFVSVLIRQVQAEDFSDSIGLMGTFEHGKLVGRDLSTVWEDVNEFGLEWQVRDTDSMLFKEARFPQFPAKCTMPTIPSSDHRRLSEAAGGAGMISQAEAEKACANLPVEDRDACVYDVLTTGDLEMAALDGFDDEVED